MSSMENETIVKKLVIDGMDYVVEMRVQVVESTLYRCNGEVKRLHTTMEMGMDRALANAIQSARQDRKTQ